MSEFTLIAFSANNKENHEDKDSGNRLEILPFGEYFEFSNYSKDVGVVVIHAMLLLEIINITLLIAFIKVYK